MGITYQDAKMLWEARLRGESFASTLTVAHQSLNLHPAEVTFLRRSFQHKYPTSGVKPLENYESNDYSDGFLRDFLGVTSLSVMDYSAYEGANLIQDLNEPIPPSLCGRFDAVIDSGSLEHIFNFPVAIASLMKMLKVGGNIFITTPANNLCGHGFYQFSPELMFRIFAPENGFSLRRVALFEAAFPSVELTSNRTTYEVANPAEVRSRVGLVTRKPVMMTVEARKSADMTPFARPPLQSDYVVAWSAAGTQPTRSRTKNAARTLFRKLPLALQASLRRVRDLRHGYRELERYSLSNTRFYKKLS